MTPNASVFFRPVTSVMALRYRAAPLPFVVSGLGFKIRNLLPRYACMDYCNSPSSILLPGTNDWTRQADLFCENNWMPRDCEEFSPVVSNWNDIWPGVLSSMEGGNQHRWRHWKVSRRSRMVRPFPKDSNTIDSFSVSSSSKLSAWLE